MGCKYSDIAVSPSELTVEAQEGYKFDTRSQYIYISKAERGLEAFWTATSEGPWLGISPREGRVPGRVKVWCRTKDLAPGTYVGAVVIESTVPVDIPRVPVILTVLPKVKPVEEAAPVPEPDIPPAEYDFPPEEAEIIPEATPKPKPQPISESVPEAESRFMKLIRWILELLRG